jgi:hypothetical protein
MGRVASAPRADLALGVNGQIDGSWYTSSPAANFGVENHFQGIVRLKDSNFMVLSGANYWLKTPQLFVIEMGSRPAVGNFGSNLDSDGANPPSDRIVAHIDFDDRTHWHLGGISTLGNLLVVPLEVSDPPMDPNAPPSSRILFYDFSDPHNPVKLPVEITRPHDNAGAAALERLPDGRFVAVANDHTNNDFYYSLSTRLEDGFGSAPFMRAQTNSPNGISGQTVQFLTQCDGRRFYVDTDADGGIPGVDPGTSRYQIAEIQGMTGVAGDSINLDFKTRLTVDCGGYCDFTAATGIFIGADQKLRTYGTPLWRNGDQIQLAEFPEGN